MRERGNAGGGGDWYRVDLFISVLGGGGGGGRGGDAEEWCRPMLVARQPTQRMT